MYGKMASFEDKEEARLVRIKGLFWKVIGNKKGKSGCQAQGHGEVNSLLVFIEKYV